MRPGKESLLEGAKGASLAELVGSIGSSDPQVAGPAIAGFERMTRTSPELAELAKAEILGSLDHSLGWLIRMNVCRLAPLIRWSESEYEEILGYLFEEVDRNEGFVAAWALNGLARFAEQDESIRPRVLFIIDEAIATGSPSVRARARNALKGLKR